MGFDTIVHLVSNCNTVYIFYFFQTGIYCNNHHVLFVLFSLFPKRSPVSTLLLLIIKQWKTLRLSSSANKNILLSFKQKQSNYISTNFVTSPQLTSKLECATFLGVKLPFEIVPVCLSFGLSAICLKAVAKKFKTVINSNAAGRQLEMFTDKDYGASRVF